MDSSTRFMVIFLVTLVIGILLAYLFLTGGTELFAIIVGIIFMAVLYKYIDNSIKGD